MPGRAGGWTDGRTSTGSMAPASMEPRQGAAAGGREEGPASSGWHPEVPGDAVGRDAARGRRGAGLGHEGAGASRRLLPPFPCHPGSAGTVSPQANRSRAEELAAPCHHRRSKGRGAAQREGCWGGEGGRRLGRGGPQRTCTPTGTTAMAGQPGTAAAGVPCPGGVPVPGRATREPRGPGPHGPKMSHGGGGGGRGNRPAVTTGLAP